MKVLHVSGARKWGGNEQQLVYLVEELERKGVDQYLFGYEKSVLATRLEDSAIRRLLIPYVKPYKKEYRRKLKDIIQEHKIDLIHLHTSDSVTGYVVTDMLHGLHTKTVFSKKGISRKTSFLSKYKYNYRKIHKIICVSEVVKEHFKKVLHPSQHEKLGVVYDAVKPSSKQEHLESTVQLASLLNLEDTTVILGNIANHTDAKDLKTLLKTIHHLIYDLQVTHVHLVQIGQYSKRTEELKELVSQLQLESYISFLGFKENAISYLPQFTLYVMTSQREGGPTTVLEAFSQHIPVVSTKVGVVGEAIEDGTNGYITQVGDYQNLARKIKILIEDKALQTKFAELSYAKFLNSFTTNHLGTETLKVYQSVLEE